GSGQPLPADAGRGGDRRHAEGAERHLGFRRRPVRLAAAAARTPVDRSFVGWAKRFAKMRSAFAHPTAERRTYAEHGMNFVRVAASVACLLIGVASAAAENYPARPIKIIVSTSAGGITDVMARVLGQYITAKTGETVVIDNRAGGGGNIAMEAVARAAPDGYTLGVANTGNIVINPYLYRTMPYDPLHDLVPVGSMGEVPLFMVVNGKLPVSNLKEFVAYAKANPVSYGSAGVGTTPHLAADAFNRRAGLNMVHVPYRGSTAA